VPDVVFETLLHGRHYIAVPKFLDTQPLAWTNIGVHATQVPKSLFSGSPSDSQFDQFEIVNQRYRVAVRPQVLQHSSPRIRLADTAILAGPHGGDLAVVQFILAADGLTECSVQIPPCHELVSVDLNGQPALITANGELRWRIGLTAPNLPQALTIITRSTPNARPSKLRELVRPTILAGDQPIPVELSLWSIAEPNEFAQAKMTTASSVNAIDQAALRFDRLVSIAESASSAAAEAPQPDGANWFRPWVTILQDVQKQTRQAMLSPSAESSKAQISHSAEDQINRASKRFEKWREESSDVLGQVYSSTSTQDQPSGNRSVSLDIITANPLGTQQVTCFVAEGGSDHLTLESSRAAMNPLQTPIFAVLIALVLALFAFSLNRRPEVVDCLYRWPHAIGIVVGIAYWAWLSPSWVGLVIVVISTSLAVRFRWPGVSLHAEASTVLRSTRGH
jgi:hypothetical protein